MYVSLTPVTYETTNGYEINWSTYVGFAQGIPMSLHD